MSTDFEFEDKNKNVYICKRDKVTLQLASERRIRHIGAIREVDGIKTWWKKVDEKNIHKKTNSWAIPTAIYGRVDRIVFSSNKKRWTIDIREVDVFKGYFQFKEGGMEQQVWIGLEHWDETII